MLTSITRASCRPSYATVPPARCGARHRPSSCPRPLLPDRGHLQEEDAAYANRKGFSKHHPALPLYTEADAEHALERFRTVRFGQPLDLGHGATAHFTHAGHSLGASSVRIAQGGRQRLFSGDLGRYDDLLMRDPTDAPEADTLVMESTCGDRLHPDDDPGDALADVIRRTVGRGGTVLIPAFAVGRAQRLLHVIAQLEVRGAIPDVPVFLNSPMAFDTTGLSAHGDADDLLRWARSMPGRPNRVFLTHGEPAASEALAARMRDELRWRVDVPAQGDIVALD